MRSPLLRFPGAFLVLATLLASSGSGESPSGRRTPAVFLRMEQGRLPEVVLLDRTPPPGTMPSRGLLVWSEAGREQWRVVPEPQRGADADNTLAMPSRFTAMSRGERAAPADDAAAMGTIQLDQLLGQLVFRGAGLLTPPNNGRCLQPQITIRRQPMGGKTDYPADEVVLFQSNRELLRIRFEEGGAKMAWSEIPGLPDRLEAGLPPGEYTLRAVRGGESTTFVVEEAEIRDWVMHIPDQLADLLGGSDSPLHLLVTVEHLLAQSDEEGRPQPYLADALDLLESVPEVRLTPHLSRLRDEILARLRGKPVAREAEDATGIVAIDAARHLIAQGRWGEAGEKLESPTLNKSPRAAGLAALYQAVILAESGQGTDEQARAMFRRAMDLLADGKPADAYLATVNYANFLLARTQDRLYNHAFEIASGVENPLIDALMNWRESLAQYQAALKIADRLGAREKAAVQTNMARLYSVLADVIRTLDPPRLGLRSFEAGERSAAEQARQLASTVAESPAGQTEETIRAVALETLAHLDYRTGDGASSRRYAEQAMEHYLAVGSLAGVEGICRLLGLLNISQETAPGGKAGEAALKHLLVAQLLAEILRDRIPVDQVGLTRAGFFARRAYVHERIVELLLAQDRAAEALRFAELAKARALEDVLAAGGSGAAVPSAGRRDLDEILADWPEGIAAVEYFLGTERAWIFAVDVSGQVSAHLLVDEQGEALRSRELIARIQQFLSETAHQADKMRARLTAGRGFDHTWQDQLHTFGRRLLPSPVLNTLRNAKTAVIVPHHILHYFPLTALVTEPDRRQLGPEQMAMPRFVLDEPFAVCYAPSLTAWDLLRQQPDAPIRHVRAAGIVEFLNAPSLPGARRDIENLQAVFGSQVRKVLPGRDACESDARKLLDEPGLMFFATHGQNYADRPLSSFLLFHPDDSNDGYLTAKELYAGRVAADLVIMSACYSGLADRSPLPGDDLFGLQRALLHSGTRTVIAGVWDVYDGTGPELMNGLFHELVAGKPVPQALADSQRAFLSRLRQSDQVEPWLHPYFWAVYTVTGDDRTRVGTGAGR